MNKKNGSGARETSGEALLETEMCPSCGRAFVGDYCPSCGQEVTRELSILDVFSGLFREVIDIENGLWPTLRGLTLRPGVVLNSYLRGARQHLMHPGRYLLASVVTSYTVYWGLKWGKLLNPLGAPPGEDMAAGTEQARMAFRRIFQYQEVQIVSTLVIAVLLAAVFGRLFSRQLDRGAKAMAFGSFLAGHTTFLAAGATLAVVVGQYLATGSPVESSRYLYAVIALSYVWGATYWTFGRSGWVGLKAALGLVWTVMEYAVTSTLAFSGWALWILWTEPEGYPEVDIPQEGLVFTGGVALGVLFLHVAGEVYARYR